MTAVVSLPQPPSGVGCRGRARGAATGPGPILRRNWFVRVGEQRRGASREGRR